MRKHSYWPGAISFRTLTGVFEITGETVAGFPEEIENRVRDLNSIAGSKGSRVPKVPRAGFQGAKGFGCEIQRIRMFDTL
jgi:hypothetical protein